MNAPFGGEFNRVDRAGDYMEGDLQLIDVTNPTVQSLIEFIQTVGGAMAGGIRLNGNDLEFYDLTAGAWIKLSSLSGTLGDIHYATPGAGQTVFNLPFTYTVGSDTLGVYLVTAGKLPGPGAPTPVYTETGPTQVTFAAAVAPFTPFVGTETLIFWVPARPIVNDTYLVKGDAADASPNALDTKVTASGAAVATSPGSPGNTLRNIDVPFAVAVPQQSAGAGSAGVAVDLSRGDHQHPAPAPGNPAVDEMKNATAVFASSTIVGAGTQARISLDVVGAHRYYWASVYVVPANIPTIVNGATAEWHIGYYALNDVLGVNTLRHELVVDTTAIVTGGSVTIHYRVYRIDET